MKKAKFGLLFLTVTMLFFSVNPIAAQASSAPTAPVMRQPEGSIDPEEIIQFLDQLFTRQMEEFHIAGITTALVEDGQVIFQKGYGYTDIEKQTPVDPANSLFRIGSVTKVFTWTAVLQLVEQGQLDLNADVNQYLDFRIPDSFSTPITLKDLMSHTAGFEQRAYEALVAVPEGIPPLGKFLATHIPARVYPPGQVSVYSDYGADLAGYIVERVSGIPFAEYVEANILRPLGMDHTTLNQPVSSQLAATMSNGYRYDGKGLQPANFELISTQPAGAMSSSAEDMAQFMIAHLQGGSLCPDVQNGANDNCGSILDKGTEQLMQSFLWAPGAGPAGYTHGFMELHLNGQRILHHGGDTAAFHSLLMLLPDQNLGLFVSYNTTNPGFSWINSLYDYINHFYPVEPAENKPLSGTDVQVVNYAGGYKPIRASYTTIEKVDGLMNWFEINNAGDGSLSLGSPFSPQKARLEEISPSVYREVSSGSKFFFQKNGEGKIAYLYDETFPFASLVKVPWHASPVFNLGLLGVCVVIFLSAILAGLFRGIARLFKKGQPAGRSILAGLAHWVSILVALLDLAALLAFLSTTLFSNQLMMTMIPYGQMSSLNLVLAAWLSAAGLTIILAGLAVLTWKKGLWGIARRVHYTAITLAALAFVWFLNYWNLLGFRY